jgi:hypothetical protein
VRDGAVLREAAVVTQVSASKVGRGGFAEERDHPASSGGGDGRERRASVGTAAAAGTARPPPSVAACVGGDRAVRGASRQGTSSQNQCGQTNPQAGGNNN